MQDQVNELCFFFHFQGRLWRCFWTKGIARPPSVQVVQVVYSEHLSRRVAHCGLYAGRSGKWSLFQTCIQSMRLIIIRLFVVTIRHLLIGLVKRCLHRRADHSRSFGETSQAKKMRLKRQSSSPSCFCYCFSSCHFLLLSSQLITKHLHTFKLVLVFVKNWRDQKRLWMHWLRRGWKRSWQARQN